MANYNSSSMWAGALGEALDAGQTYTFALQTFAYPSQSVYANTAYFMVDSSTATNENLKRSSINPIVLLNIFLVLHPTYQIVKYHLTQGFQKNYNMVPDF